MPNSTQTCVLGKQSNTNWLTFWATEYRNALRRSWRMNRILFALYCFPLQARRTTQLICAVHNGRFVGRQIGPRSRLNEKFVDRHCHISFKDLSWLYSRTSQRSQTVNNSNEKSISRTQPAKAFNIRDGRGSTIRITEHQMWPIPLIHFPKAKQLKVSYNDFPAGLNCAKQLLITKQAPFCFVIGLLEEKTLKLRTWSN